jgi:hypothetical protein
MSRFREQPVSHNSFSVPSDPPLSSQRHSYQSTNAHQTSGHSTNSKPWSHLFRSSLFTPETASNTPSVIQDTQLSQSPDSGVDSNAAFTFCQNRLLTSSSDLTKLIQDVSSLFKKDKEAITNLVGEANELITTTREENRLFLEENMTKSTTL